MQNKLTLLDKVTMSCLNRLNPRNITIFISTSIHLVQLLTRIVAIYSNKVKWADISLVHHIRLYHVILLDLKPLW